MEIGVEQIRKARGILADYKKGKTNLEDRIIHNERWYKLCHWERMRESKKPVSAWLFNALANKHADAMDNYPYPNVLPREEGDERAAEMLSSVLPTLLEYNKFAQVYNDVWWYKIKNGTGVYQVVWDKNLNGIGDVSIRKADILNLFWEPGISDIQKSANMFHVELHSKDELMQSYPNIEFNSDDDKIVASYIHDDAIDKTNKVLVVDWYYKKTVNGKEVLHLCKFANEHILYSSENEGLETYYEHNKYPFVFDVLYPEEDTPAGFGYIDILKDTQMYIDKLQDGILRNVIVSSKKRVIVRTDSGINEDDLMDVEKELIRADASLGQDSFRELTYQPLPSISQSILDFKINELKETSGNRDFSTGATMHGVTSGSAIAALQESGSKLSRDSIHSAYRAFTEICYFVIELIRQFYTEERTFRIVGENGYEFVKFNNELIAPQAQEPDYDSEGNEISYGDRVPIFDVKVTPEKDSSFNRLSNNDLALQFFQLGFFNPENADVALGCIEMMKFDAKEEVKKTIQSNGTMYEKMVAMQEQLNQLSQVVDMQNGTNVADDMQFDLGTGSTNGASVRMPAQSQSEKAAAAAADMARPK